MDRVERTATISNTVTSGPMGLNRDDEMLKKKAAVTMQ
jgi:hypothetical protein